MLKAVYTILFSPLWKVSNCAIRSFCLCFLHASVLCFTFSRIVTFMSVPYALVSWNSILYLFLFVIHIASVLCKSGSLTLFCFANVSFFTIVLLTFYQIANILTFTINLSCYVMLCSVLHINPLSFCNKRVCHTFSFLVASLFGF